MSRFEEQNYIHSSLHDLSTPHGCFNERIVDLLQEKKSNIQYISPDGDMQNRALMIRVFTMADFMNSFKGSFIPSFGLYTSSTNLLMGFVNPFSLEGCSES